jgi:hypothetical protein
MGNSVFHEVPAEMVASAGEWGDLEGPRCLPLMSDTLAGIRKAQSELSAREGTCALPSRLVSGCGAYCMVPQSS